MENWVKIGEVSRARGLSGELVVRLLSESVEWKGKLDQVSLSGSQFSVISSRRDKAFLVLRLKGITSRELAESLRGRVVSLPQAQFQSDSGERLFLRELLGFSVFDGGQLIGKVRDFSSNGPQDLLVVEGPSADSFLIPFVEPFIEKIDLKNQQIKLLLPSGLLEINQ